MDCREVRLLLEDFHYGELVETESAEISAHLRRCASCSGELELLQSEQEFYDRQARREEEELGVPREMWRQVSARLKQLETRSPYSAEDGRSPAPAIGSRMTRLPAFRFASYGALALLVIFGVILAVRMPPRTAPQESVKAGPAQKPGVADEGTAVTGEGGGMGGGRSYQDAMVAIRRAEKEYIEAIRILSDLFEKRKSALDPKLAAELDRNLKAIDEAITSTREAYMARPGDPELALYMLRAYARKVEILQDLTT